LWSAVAVLVGSTIGSGIFRTPAGVARLIDDVPLFLLAWVLGAAVVLCGALTYSELAAAFPRSGGVYVFVREAFGPTARVPVHVGGAARHPAGRVWRDRHHGVRLHTPHAGPRSRRRPRAARPAVVQRRAGARRRVTSCWWGS